jgi:hypothetical protein
MASQSPSEQGTASVEDIERYEVIDGVRVEREPMGAFETVLASWLCSLINAWGRGAPRFSPPDCSLVRSRDQTSIAVARETAAVWRDMAAALSADDHGKKRA